MPALSEGAEIVVGLPLDVPAEQVLSLALEHVPIVVGPRSERAANEFDDGVTVAESDAVVASVSR